MFFGQDVVIFHDRADAGRKLAKELRSYADRNDVLVLGIPRGGVVVAFEVAKALHAPLDIFVSRKLGVPGQEELAFGAVSSGGVRILDQEIVGALAIPQRQIEECSQRAREELERRERLYRGGRPPLALEGRTVILVDDGIATGSSMRAAIQALRQLKPARLAVAVPVAPQATCARLKREVDELVCVQTPKYFYAIGQFYEDFSQVGDEEVSELLALGAQPALQSA
jgi:putative phosphoribosyl transferase